MILELTGSRVVGPQVGTSIIVWTSLIGIILASLSLGYWAGGRLADKKPSMKTLSLLFLYSAAGVFYIIPTNVFIFSELLKLTADFRIVAVVGSVLLFSPASIGLGMISPYIIRLRLKTVATSGKTIGTLSALATIGSITGTFLTGFVLLAFLGTTKILLLISIILAITGIWVHPSLLRKRSLYLIILAAISIYSFQIRKPTTLIDIDTPYNRAFILETTFGPTQQRIKVLKLNTEFHSAMFIHNDELVAEYTKFYRLAKYYNPNIQSALFIGGGAYSYPKDFLIKEKNATMDVVEIDPGITEIAREYFRLPNSNRLHIFHEDGRTYLNRNQKKYDAIFIDAFLSYYSIPFQLTTLEATRHIERSLSRDGVVMVNIISSIEGDKGKFLRALHRTYKSTFTNVAIFPVDQENEAHLMQNIMLVAWNNASPTNIDDNEEFSYFLSHRWKYPIPEDVPILTDDFAPVDQYIASLME